MKVIERLDRAERRLNQLSENMDKLAAQFAVIQPDSPGFLKHVADVNFNCEAIQTRLKELTIRTNGVEDEMNHVIDKNTNIYEKTRLEMVQTLETIAIKVQAKDDMIQSLVESANEAALAVDRKVREQAAQIKHAMADIKLATHETERIKADCKELRNEVEDLCPTVSMPAGFQHQDDGKLQKLKQAVVTIGRRITKADEKIDALSELLVEKKIFESDEVHWAMGEQGKLALRIKRAQKEAYEHRRGRSRSSDRGSVASETSSCEYNLPDMTFQLVEDDLK